MPKEKLNILLIDDDKDECSFFKDALHEAFVNFELTCCTDALDEVYYELADKDFHLIFLDINLPGENGIKFLRTIKTKENYQHIPVIMYTVSVNPKDIEESYTAGAHRFMVKPYAHANFIETLNKLFSIDWALPQPIPRQEQFVINLAFV